MSAERDIAKRDIVVMKFGGTSVAGPEHILNAARRIVEARKRGKGVIAVLSLQISITGWLGDLKEGDQAAAQPLWERYFSKLVVVARAKLRRLKRGAHRVTVDLLDQRATKVQPFNRTDREFRIR